MESKLFTKFKQDSVFTAVPRKMIWAMESPVSSVFIVR